MGLDLRPERRELAARLGAAEAAFAPAEVGEGNGLRVPEVSPTLIHASITILASWVTSFEHMPELVSRSPV